MKVLMTADAVGGVWTYALELCMALSNRDVQFVLATMGPAPSAAQRDRLSRLPNVRLEHSTWKLEWMEQPWDDVAAAGAWLLGLAERENVDVIHLNGYAHAVLPWQRPVVVVAHSCVCSWWDAVYGHAAPREWDHYREVVSAGLRAAQRVIAPTDAFMRTLEMHYGPLPQKTVIRNARSWPAQHENNERLPMIFACGRVWDQAKNFATLDAAARDLAWPVTVAGEHTSPDGRKCELSNLRCIGAQPDHAIETLLERTSIFVHPARYEPFGLAVFEAAMHGCALVLSDLPTLRELWEGAAVFADPNDASALRKQLEMLIERADVRESLAQAALRRAERYRPEAMSTAYLAVYRDLLHGPKSAERAVA